MSKILNKFGLKNIYTDIEPNIENIVDIYNKTHGDFLINKELIKFLVDYYKGNQYCGIPDTKQLTNEKIVVNYTKQFCDTCVSITLTKPLTYISRVDDDVYKQDVETISRYLADEGDHDTNLQTYTDMVVNGVGYQYCLQQNTESDPTPNSPFTIGRFSPENTYVVRSYGIGNKVVCSFHETEINGQLFITAFDKKYKYVISRDIGEELEIDKVNGNMAIDIYGNVVINKGGFIIKAVEHNLPFNPIIEYKADMYGLSTVADLIGLQDSLNTAISNYDNDVLMKIRQLLVVTGCELSPEQIKSLKSKGILNLPQSANNNANIDAKFVSSQLNDSIITYINDTIDRMSSISGCPNTNTNGNAETGLAMQVQNGHTLANFMSNRREQSFYKPKRQQLANVIEILRRTGKLKSEITENDIEIKFDKNRLTSQTENINNIIALISNGVEPIDALNVCPVFEDNYSVAERIKANKQKEQNNNGQNEVQQNTVSELQKQTNSNDNRS